MKSDSVSISFANLFTNIRFSGKRVPFTVRHPTNLDLWQSLSAGPGFHYMALRQFPETFGVAPDSFVEKTPPGQLAGYDARITVPAEYYEGMVQYGLDAAAGIDSLMRWDPLPELKLRLTQPYWSDVGPPLSEDDFSKVHVLPRKIVRQPTEASGQGGKGAKVRIFRLCDLILPDVIADRLMQTNVFDYLSDDELASTNGGRKQGSRRDGKRVFTLSNNVGVDGQDPLLF